MTPPPKYVNDSDGHDRKSGKDQLVKYMHVREKDIIGNEKKEEKGSNNERTAKKQ